ncbi:MAG: CehA/McbA family metallohydrolase, partial [Proteobacteria bacterium]|nr:CehA/McbA family metallohydrolase [Pseudomonadota bacterium]
MTKLIAQPLLLALLIAAVHAGPAHAAVSVIVGPTPIPDGEAAAARDITVMNERLAFALAVESPVPYGVPRGALIDIGPVVGGQPERDRVVFADFIPNNWSAWPNTYQKVDIVERGPQQVVLKATRDWGKVTVTTTYTLRSNADRIEMQTVMTNGGDAPLADLLSGQTLWPSAGYFFGVPGLGELQEGRSTAALADRAVAYDENWSIALHAPYMNFVGSRSKDLFLQHTLQPGQSRTFDAWLQVGPRGDLSPVVAAEIERGHLPAGMLRGSVKTRDGKPVSEPVVVVSKQGTPYAWSFGHDGGYEVPLPTGDYEIYATGKGYSQGKRVPVTITANNVMMSDFADVEPPGQVDFTVVDARTAQPLDARIGITAGQRQLVEFLGRNTFFTELDRKGRLQAAMAPGGYSFTVSSGGGVLGPNQVVTLDVRPGQTATAKVALTRLFDPPASGWYSADLHHHADQAEGVTPPEFLARSQLAAGLDLLFVSDHESTANHAPLQKIADARGVPFIPSLELSPSWGHFNAWPLKPGQKLAIDTATATIDDVLGEARRQGALVVQSNHPFIPYGYLANLSAGLVPGGFNP